MKNEQRIFEVSKSVALNLLDRKILYVDSSFENLERAYSDKSVSEEIVILTRLAHKLVGEHNTKIQAHRTKLDHLRFGSKWRDSALWNGINLPWREIEKRVAENPDMDHRDISRKFFYK